MLSWVKSFITFVTISVPRLIYFVLSYSMTLTVSISFIIYWSNSDLPLLAELLVLCVPLRCISSRFELLDSLAVSQYLFTAQRTAARQTRC